MLAYMRTTTHKIPQKSSKYKNMDKRNWNSLDIHNLKLTTTFITYLCHNVLSVIYTYLLKQLLLLIFLLHYFYFVFIYIYKFIIYYYICIGYSNFLKIFISAYFNFLKVFISTYIYFFNFRIETSAPY
jgi:hypothetical protein